jgi:hypothetical protein
MTSHVLHTSRYGKQFGSYTNFLHPQALPYNIEVPKDPPAPRKYEYGYSVDVPPQPKRDKRRYSYDYQLLVPRKDPVFVGGSYDYKLEVPPEAKEEPKCSFSYELHVPKPKPQTKT